MKIDPPYNTGNDGFNYNDSFNHSTWLTFMKNRLEIAKRLLREDGVIFVQCDDNEQAYLKVLMDEIFGRENFVSTIIPLMNPRGRQESAYPIARSHEYIIVFSKVPEKATFYNFGILKSDELHDKYRLLSLRKSGNASLKSDRPNMFYPIYYNEITGEVYVNSKNKENEIIILPIKADGQEGRWRWSKENLENNINLVVCKKNSKNLYDIYVKDFLIQDGKSKGSKTNTFLIDKNIINDKAKKHLELLFADRDIFSYPKSEYLIQRILEISTQPNDLVLDFHLGSGTTAAVAHKVGRRYIGVEQMDYIETVAVERLRKVIEGEQGGISEFVHWQGGGSFVYCELMENASLFIDAIQSATEETIAFIKETIYENERIIPYITREELNSADEIFGTLSLEEKKQALIKLIDKNKLYVNYSDVEDSGFKVEEKDKIFTKSFYKEI